MSLVISGFDFEGPHQSVEFLKSKSGVYAVVCIRSGDYTLIDVGESHDVQSRVYTHDRRPCWENKCKGTLQYCAFYTPFKEQPGRKQIERKIRNQFKFLCGEG